MTYVDAYGLVALLANEPAAAQVERLLRSDQCGVAAVNLAEAVDVTARVHLQTLDDIRAAVEPLILGNAIALAVSHEAEVWLAAEIRIAHYSRRERPLSMADCLLLAHAELAHDAIATSDPAVASVARARGLGIVPLPDREGNLP